MMYSLFRRVATYAWVVIAPVLLTFGDVLADGGKPATAPAFPLPAVQPPAIPANPSPQPPGLSKPAAPDQAARAPFVKLAHDVYEKEYADRSLAGRRALARKLLEDGEKEQRNIVAHYVLLDEALSIALASADMDTCRKAVDALDQSFAIDAGDMIVQVLTRFPNAGDEDSLCAWSLEYVERLISHDNAAAARRVIKLITARVNRAKDPANKTALKNVEAMLAEYDRIRAALDKLAADPNDPASNLAAGRYYCFSRHDFDKGLPLLARGGDPALKELAQRDLANPTDAKLRYQLGGSWWNLGDQKANAAIASALHERARFWYAATLPELSGLQKSLAEKRLADAPPSLTKLGQNLTYLATFDSATIGHVGPDSVLKDAIGRQSAGVIHGCTLVDGKFGQAMHFNGNDYIDLTATQLAPAGTTPRTITVWTRTDARGVNAILALGSPANGQAFNILVGIGGPGVVGVMGFSCDFYPNRGTSITDGNWHFVSVVFDKRVTIYVDGAVDNTAPDNIPYQTGGQNNYIGSSNHVGHLRRFHGDLDDLAIWQRALSAEEISQIYKSGLRGVSLSDLIRKSGIGK